MEFEIRISDRTNQGFDEITIYLFHQFGNKFAEEYRRDLLSVIESLKTFPYRGREAKFRNKKVRTFIFRRLTYVRYSIEPDYIAILAIYDTRKNFVR